MTVRRIDPEPITIYLAIAATFSATVAAANYVKTHYKPLPSAVRVNVSRSLVELEDHVKRLRADLSILRDIFSKAEFQDGRGIRLGNGAYLTSAEFSRYMKVSKGVMRRLAEVNEVTLKMERETTRLSSPPQQGVTNVLGAAYEELERLLQSRNLSVDDAWEQMESIANSLEAAIRDIRKQLGQG